MTYDMHYAYWMEKVEQSLSSCLSSFEKIPQPLCEAMTYSLLAGGKRLRPILLLAAAELVEDVPAHLLPMACAVEMIHTYSLIHDDLPGMDDDDFRRGRSTNHKVYGEGMAILAGDGLLNAAYELMLRETLLHPDQTTRYVDAMHTIASAAGVTGMIAGQCMDLTCERQKTGDAQSLSFIHQHKTADLLTAPLVAGLQLVGGTSAQIKSMHMFGQAMGMAFQIVDDLLDVEGDATALGKQIGMDAAHGKLTWPAIHGMDAAHAAADAYSRAAQEALESFGTRAVFLRELAARMNRRRQ